MKDSKLQIVFRSLLVRILVGFGLLASLVTLIVYIGFRQSLPQLEGSIATSGVDSPVTVTRDADGVPTIHASTRVDASYALGYLHAQERFFQMDLLRRTGAGELAELMGDAALAIDKRRRRHRFRHRSELALATFAESDLGILSAYTNGINDGLNALGRAPFEYTLLRADPKPWAIVDNLLVVYAMYFDFQDEDNNYERNYGLLYDIMGKDFAEFLFPRGTTWDAPLDGGMLPTPPTPDRKIPVFEGEPLASKMTLPNDSMVHGSNNWAVGGALTDTGAAIVANDMHTGLGVPNIWYRVRLIVDDTNTNITGVTLPGTPAIAVGSNGHVAWSMTASMTDTQDIVYLEWIDEQAGIYKTPNGSANIEVITERICSSSGSCTDMIIRESIWGPLLGNTDHRGRTMATNWIAHDPNAANLHSLKMENAETIEEVFSIAHKAGIPTSNLVVGDRQGNIGYTIFGSLPARFGHSGLLPSSWSDGSRGWNGRLASADIPAIINPPNHILWSANARMLSGEMLDRVGYGRYAPAARQHQVRKRLLALESANEDDMLAIQLDDEALFLARWRTLLLSHQANSAEGFSPEVLSKVENWEGRAVPESIGFRIVGSFRWRVTTLVMTGLTQAVVEHADENFLGYNATLEGPVWRLINERPLHLLPAGYSDWNALLDLAFIEVKQDISANGGLDNFTLGNHTELDIDHPLSDYVPGLGWLTDTPKQQIPGYFNSMPRINAGDGGASERIVVSPGHEEDGYFHMPSGQSGHPLSPYYNKGHENWVNGAKSPFLPGEVRWTLIFEPR